MFLSSSFTTTNSNLIPWYDSLFLALGVGAPRQDRWRLCHNQHSEGCLSSPTHLPAHSSPTTLGLLWPHPWAVSFLLPPYLFSKSFLCCPHVSPPPLGRCICYRSNRLLWCCPFDLMRETPTIMMCMCFFPRYLAGDLDIHIPPRILLFLWVLPFLPLLSQLNKLFSPSPTPASSFLLLLPVQPWEPPHFPCPPCLLWLLFSKAKPFTHSEGSEDLSLTSQMLTKFLIILCLSTARVQRRVSDFRHKSLAFSQAGWTPGSLLKHHQH